MRVWRGGAGRRGDNGAPQFQKKKNSLCLHMSDAAQRRIAELELEVASLRQQHSGRQRIASMSAEVVANNPYSRLLALKTMGIVPNYEVCSGVCAAGQLNDGVGTRRTFGRKPSVSLGLAVWAPWWPSVSRGAASGNCCCLIWTPSSCPT